MPEDSKKNQQKSRNDPKDQRRRRQGRHPAGPVEKKPEKQPEAPKVPEQEKPAYEPPGPEFFKNLKRETDEILKITEEASSKYKKKEILSNWAKYEMPVESYDDIDDKENMGADYEKLIQASVSTGGHFQFKHEKSWDIDSGPSLYDKYFDINMDLLSLAVSTIPFYERNSIDQSLFNESDIGIMNHRATKCKQKYYNDKKYATPEMETQDKILSSLRDKSNEIKDECDNSKYQSELDDNVVSDKSVDIKNNMLDIKIEKTEEAAKEAVPTISSPIVDNNVQESQDDFLCRPESNNITTPVKVIEKLKERKENISTQNVNKIVDEDLNDVEIPPATKQKVEQEILEKREKEIIKEPEIVFMKVDPPKEAEKVTEPKATVVKEAPQPVNPVIQSPEDLEKWLDDFLDG